MTTMDIIMTRSSLRLVTVLLFITTTISIVEASVNPWGGSGSGGGSSAGPSDSYYAYSQHKYSLEQSPSSTSSSSTTSIVHDDTEITSSDHVDEPKIVSLINHEGGGGEGFVVSTQALFCQGGAGALQHTPFPPNSAASPPHSFGAYFWEVDSERDESESEDDDNDDDDNDGHSSMLSNASVNRARAYSTATGGGDDGFGRSAGFESLPSSRLTTSTTTTHISNSKSSSFSAPSSWGIHRGGGGANTQRNRSLDSLLKVRGGENSDFDAAHERATGSALPAPTTTTTIADEPSGTASTTATPLTTTTTTPMVEESPVVAIATVASGLASIFGSKVARGVFVSVLVTFIFEGLCGHILEFLKICMQTSDAGATYGSVIRAITQQKGIGGLWDGFVPWGMVQAISKGAVFGLAHTTASKLLVPLADKGTIPMALALTLAGGIGGGFQGYVLSPTLLLKTRVMTNPAFREKMSLLKTTLLSFTIGFDVVRQEGFLTLMKGSNVFALKRVFDWASRYYFADLFEAAMVVYKKGQALTLAEKSAASFLGGVASTCVTLPLDVLVAKTQDAKKAGVKVSAIQLFNDELKEKGWSGLRQSYMKGFEARLAHVCLTVVVMKTMAPVVYQALFPEVA